MWLTSRANYTAPINTISVDTVSAEESSVDKTENVRVYGKQRNRKPSCTLCTQSVSKLHGYIRQTYASLLSLFSLIAIVISSGCTTVTIDETRRAETNIIEGESVVVIGRRSGTDYETEPDLVDCVGKVLSSGSTNIHVIPEAEFVDSLYPWFEPRTAPVRAKDLYRLVEHEKLANIIDDYNVRYFVWVDGSTQTMNSFGQINCGLTAAGFSCFGFGSWDKKADYEASIWDYKTKTLIGKVSSTADGTSYMPAIVVPIPIIAPVQGDACKAMGAQLRVFLGLDSASSDDDESL
ncbi:hypothetical protein [Flocculibacter collagenilyticus]|uniref:hypothetical protein n=1 Tax=Flocculibacter collagenilyticus TaxID=2744479 RepID=UPI0018F34FE7|nr:hypothetical protein [Flocculibacter collagenilyticus]